MDSLPPSAGPPAPKRGLFKWLLLGCLGLLVILPFTPAGGKVYRGIVRLADRLYGPPKVRTETQIVTEEKIVDRPVEIEVPVEVLPPLPSGPDLTAKSDLKILFNGMEVKSNLKVEPGTIASKERTDNKAYGIEFNVHVRIPAASKTIEELKTVNAALPTLLPGLPALVAAGKVSPFYDLIYSLKQKDIQASILRLDRVLSRHNFYDLETILQLEHPETKQKVFLMQAEMDVVADGSDGDRMPTFDQYIFKSTHFQPTSSYGWPKVTAQPNPAIALIEGEIATMKTKAAATTRSADKASLQRSIDYQNRVIADLKKRSYLIAQEDPFVVIPLSTRGYRGQNEWTPSVGDYAVVIYENKVLPAIVGDYGPATKVGEASLRIARELSEKATPYYRPVSDLKVTYLIFPDSADKPFRQPDYAVWRTKCAALLDRIGGLGEGVTLHEWEDRLKKPEPAPTVPPVPVSIDPVQPAAPRAAPER